MVRVAAAFLTLGLVLTGCSQAQEAVENTVEQATELAQNARYCVQAARVAQAVQARDVDTAVSAGESLVQVAPDEIVDEAQLILDAARQAQDGDPSALQSDEVQAAAQTLSDFTRDTCDPTS